jgi:hypothetical protein
MTDAHPTSNYLFSETVLDECIQIVKENLDDLANDRATYEGRPNKQAGFDRLIAERRAVLAALEAMPAHEPCARHTLDCDMVMHPNCTRCNCGSSIDESLSARKGSEKSDGLHSDHRGIWQARSSEGGIGGQSPVESIQSREPVDSNTVPVGRASPESIHTKDVDPAPSIAAQQPGVPRAWMDADGIISSAPGGGYNIPLFAGAATPPKVGCEGKDGLLRIHGQDEHCDVCRPAQPPGAERVLIADLLAAIERIADPWKLTDHACEECVPGADVGNAKGFRCARHRAMALLAGTSQPSGALLPEILAFLKKSSPGPTCDCCAELRALVEKIEAALAVPTKAAAPIIPPLEYDAEHPDNRRQYTAAEKEGIRPALEQTERCWSVKCTKPPMQGSVLCEEHYNALPASMRADAKAGGLDINAVARRCAAELPPAGPEDGPRYEINIEPAITPYACIHDSTPTTWCSTCYPDRVPAEVICPNCETALPEGCGGTFKESDGDACWLNRPEHMSAQNR